MSNSLWIKGETHIKPLREDLTLKWLRPRTKSVERALFRNSYREHPLKPKRSKWTSRVSKMTLMIKDSTGLKSVLLRSRESEEPEKIDKMTRVIVCLISGTTCKIWLAESFLLRTPTTTSMSNSTLKILLKGTQLAICKGMSSLMGLCQAMGVGQEGPDKRLWSDPS